MKVGDYVSWASQAGGFQQRKRGVIIAVVPPGKTPAESYLHIAGRAHASGTMAKLRALGVKAEDYTLRLGGGGPRKHESYLVAVGDGILKRRLYWPVTSKLHPVEGA